MTVSRFIATLIALSCLGVPARAQIPFFEPAPEFIQRPPAQKPKEKPKAEQPKPKEEANKPALLPDPPYQSRLERLSEILGALHYLRPLCVPGETQTWRDLMLNLLAAENPTPAARERMIASFNHAYKGFRENYRSCTPSAKLAGSRYRTEGIKLSRDLTSLFTD